MRPRQSQSLLGVSAALLVAVSLVVTFGVIPGVRATSAPNISAESAVPAFWVGVGLHLAAALIVVLTGVVPRVRGRASKIVLIATGIAILFFGFLLSDAALAFREAGSSLQTVTTLLILCVIADVAAGTLAIAAAFRRPATT